jgi:hypothetical protein
MNRKHSWLVILGMLVLVTLSAQVLGDEVAVKDGRVFSGVITSGVPELISIDVNGVISTVKRDAIRRIEYKSVNAGTIETIKGDVFKGSITTEMPSHIVITTDVGAVTIKNKDIVTITFTSHVGITGESESPWDYVWLESLVGTLGAAGGGIIVGGGAAIIVGLATDTDPYAIFTAAYIGSIVGSLSVPIIAVNEVGKAHDVKGNLGLGFSMEIGGGVLGFLLDSAAGTPFIFTLLGTGCGAAIGYNVGAKIQAQPTVMNRHEIQLVSIGMEF